MAWTQAHIDALREAIALGAKKVKYFDKEIEYRSISEMRDILAEMEADVNPSINKTRRKYAAVSSGRFGSCE